MERSNRRRSPARVSSPSNSPTTHVDQSSNEKLKSIDRPHRGNHQRAKHRSTKSDSDSCSRKSEERQHVCELGRSDLKSSGSTLMKNLLADEMSKEIESRRRTPSIIAKLMGLDGMPSQLSNNKQSGRFSDGFQGKTTSAGSTRSRRSCNNQSCRNIAKDQQLFKDVYEVRESLKGRSDKHTDHMPANRNKTEDDMVFMRQMFMDAKRLSTDENLRNLEEFDDSLEVLGSNNHLFFKFLQEPDSLLAKHLHDLHGSHEPLCVHMRNLRPSNVLDYNINVIGCQAGREASQKIDISLSYEHNDVLHGHRFSRYAKDLDRSLNFSAEFKDVNASPTKIVVLKPNFARIQDRAECVSVSPSFSRELSSDVNVHTKHTYPCRREDDLWGKKNYPSNLEFSSSQSRESKELAKEVTRQMRRKLGDGSFNVSWSGYRGYSADESSLDISGNDSSYESDVSIPTPRTPSRRSIRSKSLPSRYAESSVNREARKRLSERWKMTQRSEGKKVANNGSTLGEMLATPDVDVKSLIPDHIIDQDEFPTRFDLNDNLEGLGGQPLGISSKDGLKEGYIAALPRCRSLLSPSYHHGDGEAVIPHAGSDDEGRHCRKKVGKRDMTDKDGTFYGSSRTVERRSQSSNQVNKVNMNKEEEGQIGWHSWNNHTLDGMEYSELKTVILETPIVRMDKASNHYAMEKAQLEIIPGTPNSGDDVTETTQFSTDGRAKDGFCGGGLTKSTSQEMSTMSQMEGSACVHFLAAPPESPVSSKEADQPSPVSVLEAPFVEYASSGSECFERVNAELHGLRMQLQLLKLESKTYDDDDADRTIHVSSDDESMEASPHRFYQPKSDPVEPDESWETYYLADVLAELSFDEATPESLTATWHFADFSAGPLLFEKLEKKYVDNICCTRQERRLLFDRINAGMFEISEKLMDPHPWVSTSLLSFCGVVRPRWSNDRLGTELWKALVDQEEREMEVKLGWMDLGMHIDCIGREIGTMILDELTSEALTM